MTARRVTKNCKETGEKSGGNFEMGHAGVLSFTRSLLFGNDTGKIYGRVSKNAGNDLLMRVFFELCRI